MAEITYHREGDYLLPNLLPPETPKIGIWGMRRRRFLQEHNDGIYTAMILSGTLNAHLAEIDRAASKMFDRLIRLFAEREGVTEQLKAEDHMEWVRRMNSIRNRVERSVYEDLIFV